MWTVNISKIKHYSYWSQKCLGKLFYCKPSKLKYQKWRIILHKLCPEYSAAVPVATKQNQCYWILYRSLKRCPLLLKCKITDLNIWRKNVNCRKANYLTWLSSSLNFHMLLEHSHTENRYKVAINERIKNWIFLFKIIKIARFYHGALEVLEMQ